MGTKGKLKPHFGRRDERACYSPQKCNIKYVHEVGIIRIVLDNLRSQVLKYSVYLGKQKGQVSENRSRTFMRENDSMKVLDAKSTLTSTLTSRYARIAESLASSGTNFNINIKICQDS